MVQLVDSDDSCSDDSDFLPGDDSSSEDDEEALNIKKKFMEFKRKCKKGQIAHLDDIECAGRLPISLGDQLAIDDGNETPYANSSDAEEESFDDSDGDIVRHNDEFPRYKAEGSGSVICLGMKFSDKKDFKNAVRQYALAARKVINFAKDEGYIVRAKFDWPTCPWVCLLSTNARVEGRQIRSLTDDQDRRDNKLVIAMRIANTYDNMIRANPQRNLLHMKSTIQEDIFAYISMSKIKRPKAIVIDIMYNSSKGEYSRVFDYQLELLKSNPGSTMIVKFDLEEAEPVFQRFMFSWMH